MHFDKPWHLPTAGELITGLQFVQQAAAAMHKPDGVSFIPKLDAVAGGSFQPRK